LEKALSEMGFSCKSNGVQINPGANMAFPITAMEKSTLDLQWQSVEEEELEFSLSFQPAEGGEEIMLKPSETVEKYSGTVDIEGPGSCILQWRNINGGFFGGSVRTVSYNATMQTKREIEEEKKAEAEAEAAQLRKELEEERQVRREERQKKLIKLRSEVEQAQRGLQETSKSIAAKDAEIARLKEELAAVEQARHAEVAMATALEQGISNAMDAIEDLEAESEDEGEESEDGGEEDVEEESEAAEQEDEAETEEEKKQEGSKDVST
jgi:hypothetical protein